MVWYGMVWFTPTEYVGLCPADLHQLPSQWVLQQVFTGQMLLLSTNHQHQSTEGKNS